MSSILDKIVEQTAVDLKKRMRKVSLRDFDSFAGIEKHRLSLKTSLLQNEFVSVIAEVKKASPSKGIIREDFEPLNIATAYRKGGAAAISVLTDEPFFKGSLDYLIIISQTIDLPILRKDFILEPYQIKEAKAYGADAVLIIVAITQGNQLHELLAAARDYGLETLVECYDQSDFDRLEFKEVGILGVNNRNLNDFKTDVHRGISLLKQAPKNTVLVSESGLSTASDLALLQTNGIHAALIGEYFMRQTEPGAALSLLLDSAKETYQAGQEA